MDRIAAQAYGDGQAVGTVCQKLLERTVGRAVQDRVRVVNRLDLEKIRAVRTGQGIAAGSWLSCAAYWTTSWQGA